MGIYIKGMEMPSSCSVCDYFEYEGGDYQPWVVCRLTEEKLEDPNSRGDECPITEVKEPHGDLIDRDPLMRTLAENKDYFEHENVNCCCYFRNSADEPSAELWCVDEWIENSVTVIERSEDDER